MKWTSTKKVRLADHSISRRFPVILVTRHLFLMNKNRAFDASYAKAASKRVDRDEKNERITPMTRRRRKRPMVYSSPLSHNDDHYASDVEMAAECNSTDTDYMESDRFDESESEDQDQDQDQDQDESEYEELVNEANDLGVTEMMDLDTSRDDIFAIENEHRQSDSLLMLSFLTPSGESNRNVKKIISKAENIERGSAANLRSRLSAPIVKLTTKARRAVEVVIPLLGSRCADPGFDVTSANHDPNCVAHRILKDMKLEFDCQHNLITCPHYSKVGLVIDPDDYVDHVLGRVDRSYKHLSPDEKLHRNAFFAANGIPANLSLRRNEREDIAAPLREFLLDMCGGLEAAKNSYNFAKDRSTFGKDVQPIDPFPSLPKPEVGLFCEDCNFYGFNQTTHRKAQPECTATLKGGVLLQKTFASTVTQHRYLSLVQKVSMSTRRLLERRLRLIWSVLVKDSPHLSTWSQLQDVIPGSSIPLTSASWIMISTTLV
jgi:hypothetical protein